MVIFGDRLIVVQAKSKKLSIAARKGNDNQLRKDFAQAIQKSYDQAYSCAMEILAGDCKLITIKNSEILLPHPPKEILTFNVISEHYPALAFQSRQFLKYQTSDQIPPPFVMDVFLLDAMTEMLNTPLRLLSYAKLRVQNVDRIMLSHELTALGFHLKRNLWIDSDFDSVMLDDEISAELDTAMLVRRDNVSGERTPEGILTRFAGAPFGILISQIEKYPDPAALELGLFLLTLGEDSCRTINQGLKFITQRTRTDGKVHDFTIETDVGGITFHCNTVPSEVANQKLKAYCELRKYSQKATRWLGLSISPQLDIQFGGVLDLEWKQSDEMDIAVAAAGLRKPIAANMMSDLIRESGRKKIGRNDQCPCGSGKKFKKCCLSR